MTLTQKIKRALREPNYLLYVLLNRFNRFIPDKRFLKWKYRLIMGRKLDLENPKTYNEKIQWLKLHDRNPEYTRMVDKIEAKKYVASFIGEEYIIPTLGVWDDVDDIDFDALPNSFVLKCSHDSGGIVICKNKDEFDIDAAKEKLKKGLSVNFYYQNREWPYKNVKPRILAEMYMEDESGYELKDYKFFCFNGEPKVLFIATERGLKGVETKFNFYDSDFNFLPFTNGHPNSSKPINKPASFELMKKLAAKLSQEIPHVRIDFYDIYGKIYFGEMTFYHWSGFTPFSPQEWDYKMGELIKLPNNR